ncbi:MAG: ribonuclease III [Spirochaetales bacterium]|nr:ribonuclease III [Spirochaetales bacterium]
MKTPQISQSRKKELLLFQSHAELRFRKLDFLNLAFCHRSYANETQEDVDNNEKLEFLGDSILGLVASEYLYYLLPDKAEGDLARIKSFVVSENTLSIVARKIKIDNYILIGRGEEYSGGRNKKAILADCVEAIIGAYYLDSGIKAVRTFILTHIVPEIMKVIENKHDKDYKTLLQEFVQKKYKTYPKYKMLKKTGPDHDRTFLVEVKIKDRTFGPGEGKNKKAAEQSAASIAYKAYIAEMGEIEAGLE